jgi:hypothetical protein
LSERSVADAQAALGYATTRTLERVAASVGLLEAAPLHFERADDVPNGAVLLALPALLAQGLLRHTRAHYELPAGFYSLETIFLVLALLALARCPSLEQARYSAPGEWGRLLGLDRIPEVKTLRAKLSVLCAQPGRAERWSTALAQEWLAASAPESAGVFYADGHVRVYHGELTALPRRYVARQKLCLRATTDYWVNALDGQPFFVVSAPVNPGLVRMLREQIVPRLLQAAPQTPAPPTADSAAGTRGAARFTLVFDREGYSPQLFAELAGQGIAILTYHKFPDQPWPAGEFAPYHVTLTNGESISMHLAERGTRLPNDLWVREVRRRTDSGHQVSVLSTDWQADLRVLAPRLMARWCQENFFKYMREHYGLDRLIEYGTSALPETTRVVNPAWRQADQAVRRQRAVLTRHAAAFGTASLSPAPEPEELERYERTKGQLHIELEGAHRELAALKTARAAQPRHVELGSLPEDQRFAQLRPEKKHLVDTIKLIAYRAESAMSALVREKLARHDDARALLRALYTTPADLIPDAAGKTLTVRLHHQASALQDAAIAHLCAELNATETIFPGTDMRLIYEPPGSG